MDYAALADIKQWVAGWLGLGWHGETDYMARHGVAA
jgi:hypothetical protein